MSYIVLQQVSSQFAKSNAKRTLDKPVALKYLRRFLSSQRYSELNEHSQDGVLYIWGAKLERGHQIEKMIPNQSLVLFRRGRRVFRIGVITDLIVDIPLAEFLWGRDADGETWAIIYFMRKVRDVTFEASAINKIIGRKETDNWQAMTSVSGKAAEDVIGWVKQWLAQHA